MDIEQHLKFGESIRALRMSSRPVIARINERFTRNSKHARNAAALTEIIDQLRDDLETDLYRNHREKYDGPIIGEVYRMNPKMSILEKLELEVK